MTRELLSLPVGAMKYGWRWTGHNRVARLDGPADNPISAEMVLTVFGWSCELRRPPRTLWVMSDNLADALRVFFDAERDGPLSPLWLEGTGIPQRPRWRRSAGMVRGRLPWPPTDLANDEWATPPLGCDRWVATASGYEHTLEVVQLPVGSDRALHYMAFVDTLPVRRRDPFAPSAVAEEAFTIFDDPLKAMGAAERQLAHSLGCLWDMALLDDQPDMRAATDALLRQEMEKL